MSTLKVNKLRDTAGSADAIVLDPNGGAVLAGVTTVTSVKVGAAVTITESGIEASGIGITVANINGTQIGGRRNLIINGAMQVIQRGSTAAGGDGTYSVDRFKFKKESTAANFDMTQSTTSPDGFSKSLKLDCTSADTSTAHNEFVVLRQSIEAQDLQQLGYGTAAAKPLVLSFYVRSNVTGVYGLNCVQNDNSSKIYSRTYTIDSADTWERKTISIPADTSGVINDDNGEGLQINFNLLLGSSYKGSAVSTAWETYANDKWGSQHGVNIASSTSNEWYLTGVQLEVGSQATAFEHRSFGEELKLCQRYYYRITPGSNGFYGVGNVDQSNNGQILINFPTTMRVGPTSLETTGTASDYVFRVTNNVNCTSVPAINNVAPDSAFLNITATSHGLTDKSGAFLRAGGSADSFLGFSSEL